MLLAHRIALAAIAVVWPVLAAAQQAQVEAVPDAPPAFDMWNLDSLEDPGIQLPSAQMPDAIGLPDVGPVEVVAPPSTDTNDPCRHFTAEERRSLPTLCGNAD